MSQSFKDGRMQIERDGKKFYMREKIKAKCGGEEMLEACAEGREETSTDPRRKILEKVKGTYDKEARMISCELFSM